MFFLMLCCLLLILSTFEEDKIKEIVKTYYGRLFRNGHCRYLYKLAEQIRNNIKITVRRNGKEDFDFC